MANLTKLKRDKMISYLEELKTQHNDDESIKMFNEIEDSLTEKKYGLVFEEHEEEVDGKLRDNIPVLCADKEKIICKDKNLPWNFIIEGDNLQALHILEKTHKGKIDCIYIDPPYNTGAKDWKYNNNYVDSNDTYRHSKWLSMMSARLKKAKILLKENGVLVCAIDENELGTTLLLLEDVFGQGYAIDPITVIHNPRGVQGDNFSYVNEYAIFVYKKGQKVIETRAVLDDDVDWSPLRNWGTESLRNDAANCFYPIYVKDDKIVGFGDDITNQMDIHPHQTEYIGDNVYAIYPIDIQGIERKWRYSRQSVESIVDLLKVKKIDNGFDILLGKNYAPYKTVWTDKKLDANEYGTQLINSMIPNNEFTFPKSVYNVYECLRAVTLYRKDAIILDFFAGSGTTGHATLILNKEDGGQRRYILCTNNDVGYKREQEFKHIFGLPKDYPNEWNNWKEKYGIASSATWPRIKSATCGFTHNKDFKETLYSKKITPSVFKNNQSVLTEIENIKKENISKYNEIKTIIEDNTLSLVGVIKKNQQIEGISSNVKYFKCDWTPRKPEDYLLSNVLCMHIREMIELQNHIEIDNVKNVLILNKDDLKNIVLDKTKYELILNIWVNGNIVFNTKELELLQKKNFKYIPKEFFGEELKEAAE